jgi:hypothetical protein
MPLTTSLSLASATAGRTVYSVASSGVDRRVTESMSFGTRIILRPQGLDPIIPLNQDVLIARRSYLGLPTVDTEARGSVLEDSQGQLFCGRFSCSSDSASVFLFVHCSSTALWRLKHGLNGCASHTAKVTSGSTRISQQGPV